METKQREKVEAMLVAVLPTLLEFCEEVQGSADRKNAESLRNLFAAHVLGGFVAKSGLPDKALHARFAREALAMADTMLEQLVLDGPVHMMGWPSNYEGVVADSEALAMDRACREDEPVASIRAIGPPVEGTRVWLFRRDETVAKNTPEAGGTVAVPVDCVGVVAATSIEAKRMLETHDEPVASLEVSHRLYGQGQRVWLFKRGY